MSSSQKDNKDGGGSSGGGGGVFTKLTNKMKSMFSSSPSEPEMIISKPTGVYLSILVSYPSIPTIIHACICVCVLMCKYILPISNNSLSIESMNK